MRTSHAKFTARTSQLRYSRIVNTLKQCALSAYRTRIGAMGPQIQMENIRCVQVVQAAQYPREKPLPPPPSSCFPMTILVIMGAHLHVLSAEPLSVWVDQIVQRGVGCLTTTINISIQCIEDTAHRAERSITRGLVQAEVLGSTNIGRFRH